VRGLPRQSIKSNFTNKIIKFLQESWIPEDLPKDMVRLAKNIEHLISQVNLDLETLNELLDNEKLLGRGVLTKDLTPYLIIVQTIIYQQPDKLNGFFRRKNFKGNKIIISKDMELNGVNIKEDRVIFI
jgi:hypothetical protein